MLNMSYKCLIWVSQVTVFKDINCFFPSDLVFLRTNMLADRGSDLSFPSVKFLIKVKKQFQFCFDVQMRSYDGYIMGKKGV